MNDNDNDARVARLLELIEKLPLEARAKLIEEMGEILALHRSGADVPPPANAEWHEHVE